MEFQMCCLYCNICYYDATSNSLYVSFFSLWGRGNSQFNLVALLSASLIWMWEFVFVVGISESPLFEFFNLAFVYFHLKLFEYFGNEVEAKKMLKFDLIMEFYSICVTIFSLFWIHKLNLINPNVFHSMILCLQLGFCLMTILFIRYYGISLFSISSLPQYIHRSHSIIVYDFKLSRVGQALKWQHIQTNWVIEWQKKRRNETEDVGKIVKTTIEIRVHI